MSTEVSAEVRGLVLGVGVIAHCGDAKETQHYTIPICTSSNDTEDKRNTPLAPCLLSTEGVPFRRYTPGLRRRASEVDRAGERVP